MKKQALMQLYLRDGAASGKRLKLDWKPTATKGAAFPSLDSDYFD